MRRKAQAMDLPTLALVALVGGGLLVAGGVIDNPFATTGKDTGKTKEGIPSNILGEDATVSAKAEDAADTSAPNVATPVDLYEVSNGNENQVNTATTNNDGSRVSVSGMSVGENYAVYYGVDNATYYADRDPATGSELIDAKTVQSDGSVHTVVSSGNLGLTLFDQDNNALSDGGSVTVGSGETYRFEKLRTGVNAENSAYNWEYIYVNDTQINSNVDEFRVDGASEIKVPDKLNNDYNWAFSLGKGADLTSGEDPNIAGNEDVEVGQVELDSADGSNPSGDIQVCVDDDATFKNDADKVQQSHSDQDDNDLNLATQCFKVTIS